MQTSMSRARMSLIRRRRGVTRGKSWGWDDIDVLLRRDKFSSNVGNAVFRRDAWFLPTVGTHVYSGWLYTSSRHYGYGYQRWEWAEVSSWDPDEDRAYHVAAYSNLRRDRMERGEIGARWVEIPSSDPIEASMGFAETTLVREEFDPSTANEIDYVIAKGCMPLEHPKWWWDEGHVRRTTYEGAWHSDSYAVPFAWEDPALCGYSLAIMGPEQYTPTRPRFDSAEFADDDEIPF